MRVVAIDGKVQRGARLPDGRQVHQLSAYDTTDGVVLAQVQIPAKSNEIPAFTPLLEQVAARLGSLDNVVFVADALHAQVAHAHPGESAPLVRAWGSCPWSDLAAGGLGGVLAAAAAAGVPALVLLGIALLVPGSCGLLGDRQPGPHREHRCDHHGRADPVRRPGPDAGPAARPPAWHRRSEAGGSRTLAAPGRGPATRTSRRLSRTTCRVNCSIGEIEVARQESDGATSVEMLRRTCAAAATVAVPGSR
ncbi:transposase [Dactylosporangium sp. NBC_01737]|uniref:transposase n=1 Tax=Dactylosporangium sp. NBC_01737 TaxID=2975959 RepID=UPI002E0FC2D4|nr:transposase [Dactylosporangium sp. NBC_01737]